MSGFLDFDQMVIYGRCKTRPGGLEPPTFGFGDRRSTN
jgi:hypothetical protein